MKIADGRPCLRCGGDKAGNKHQWCRPCYNAYYREKRKDPETKARLYQKTQDWKKRNPEKWQRIRRNSVLKREFGITIEQYEAMLEAQGNVCAICSDPIGDRGGVDHNHSTGKVRDVLCQFCNIAIGNLRDDPQRAEAVAAYLRRHEED